MSKSVPCSNKQKRTPARKPGGKSPKPNGAKRRKNPAAGSELFDGLEQRHLDLDRPVPGRGRDLPAIRALLRLGRGQGRLRGRNRPFVYLFGTFGAPDLHPADPDREAGCCSTGTSVSALARGIGHGLRALFFGGAQGQRSDRAHRCTTGSEEWRRAGPRRTHRGDAGGADRRDERLPGRGRRELRPDRGARRRRRRRHLRPRGAVRGADTTRRDRGRCSEPEDDRPDARARRQPWHAPSATPMALGPGASAARAPPRTSTDPRARTLDWRRPTRRPRMPSPGHLRGQSPTSEEIDYRLPSPRVLERGKGDKGPDPERPAGDRPAS